VDILENENFIFGLNDKILKIEKYCEKFLKEEEDNFRIIKKKFSIIPTFLFYGLPGTGKTTIANEVYKKLKKNYNIDLYFLQIDELISYNFGESSKNMRNFFEKIRDEIEKNNSFAYIIIDELDSFTVNRYQNDNESIKRILLTFNSIIDNFFQQEEFNKIIIVATTNMEDSLDTSILRRFFFHENFNITLDKKEFFNFLNEINKILNCFYFENIKDKLFKIYQEKKFTLGELKTIFIHLYMEEKKLDLKIFTEKESFFEMNQRERKEEKNV
jgi:AAA ATPase central domain protein